MASSEVEYVQYVYYMHKGSDEVKLHYYLHKHFKCEKCPKCTHLNIVHVEWSTFVLIWGAQVSSKMVPAWEQLLSSFEELLLNSLWASKWLCW